MGINLSIHNVASLTATGYTPDNADAVTLRITTSDWRGIESHFDLTLFCLPREDAARIYDALRVRSLIAEEAAE